MANSRLTPSTINSSIKNAKISSLTKRGESGSSLNNRYSENDTVSKYSRKYDSKSVNKASKYKYELEDSVKDLSNNGHADYSKYAHLRNSSMIVDDKSPS